LFDAKVPTIDNGGKQMFTRRHYIFIAEVIGQLDLHPSDKVKVGMAFANAFSAHEPKFNPTMFVNQFQAAVSEYDSLGHCGLDADEEEDLPPWTVTTK
jgi:hypothetical protein